jgi:RecA-family ATPase
MPEASQQEAWLVEGLWGSEAVGIIGGEPKCGKSFLALDLAVAVAAGVPCLRRFPARQKGPVLLYAAEDAATIVRLRLEGITHAADVEFESLDVHVITTPTLRLDRNEHCHALRATMANLRPKLLVLDPFVRLHAIDENAAGEVAPLLGFLRSLQRDFHTAVALVHHARKGAAHERGGQALRGSSELHAWGDSNL